MEKAFNKTDWNDDFAPFITADELDRIENGIDTIDDRVVELSAQSENFATKDEIPEVNIATSESVGLVKPDGSTTYIDSDGTIHAVGGGGGGTGGTSNYNDLLNKPSINGVTLQGNKTLDDIGVGALAEEKVSDLHEDTLGGFTPVIDSTGKITGYKTKAGADTVFPFSSGGKFATLNVIMSANATDARPFSYQITNDANEEYFGDFVTSATSNNAQLTFKKNGKYKVLFRSAYRGLQSNCSVRHNDTYIEQNVNGNKNTTEHDIDAVVGDTLRIAITNKTNSYGFQAGEVTVYPA